MNVEQKLSKHLEGFHTAPFLFVGSGLSRRYLNLEDWEGLLRRFADLTNHPFEYYRSSANGSNPAIATEIAKEVHPVWWANDAFRESREKYKSEATSRESALKIEIARYLEGISEPKILSPTYAEELDLLREATIDGVITTNWDLMLENIFPRFVRYVGQEELLFSPSHGIGEIYKIHGCCSKPNSLVATTQDYDRFAERNAYLAAKLLTVFVEHPVIFLGYSLTDENITEILHTIAACLTSDNIDQLRDRLVLVRWDEDPANTTWSTSSIVTHGQALPVQTITTDSFVPIFRCLSEQRRKFPAAVLRNLKEHVYELVHENDPADRLFVADIDDEDVDPSQIKVVYGVGLRVDDDGASRPAQPSTDVARTFETLADELEAFVRAWRNDGESFIPRSRLDVFYQERLTLELHDDHVRCLLVSAMHHQGTPIHYWAWKLGRLKLVPFLTTQVNTGAFYRERRAARLAFALGMSDGEGLLSRIAGGSKFSAVRKLAERLLEKLKKTQTIFPEYRSPALSTHAIDGVEIVVDVSAVHANGAQTERVLSFLATQADQKARARLKQLDAYFYGGKI